VTGSAASVVWLLIGGLTVFSLLWAFSLVPLALALAYRPARPRGRPVPLADLRRALLALNRPGRPWRLTPLSETEMRLDWEVVDPSWHERFARVTLSSRYKARFLLHEGRHEVRRYESLRTTLGYFALEGWRVRFGWRVSYAGGWVALQRWSGVAYGITGGFPPRIGRTESFSLDTGAAAREIEAAVNGAGWGFRPVPLPHEATAWGARLGDRLAPPFMRDWPQRRFWATLHAAAWAGMLAAALALAPPTGGALGVGLLVLGGVAAVEGLILWLLAGAPGWWARDVRRARRKGKRAPRTARARLIALALAAGAPAAAGPAAARTLAFPEVAVEATFARDGTARIEERITYRLDGDWRGGVQTRSLDGLEALDAVEVLEDGVAYREGGLAAKGHFAVTRSAGAVEVRWRSRNDDEPPYRDAVRTFTLRYRAVGLVRPEGEVDEIWWRALFADREAPVGRVSVLMRLPGPVDPGAVGAALASDAGAIGREWVDARTLRFRAEGSPPGDRFEVRVRVPAGAFDRAALAGRRPEEVRLAWGRAGGLLLAALLPALTFGALWRRHRRHGRDPDAAAPETDWTRYEPDLPPAVVGALLDEDAGVDEVSATVVDLARRGYLRLGGVRAFWIERLREPDASLLPYECEVIDALFAGANGGARVSRADLGARFHERLPALEASIAAEATRRGLFPANPELARRRWFLAGFGAVLAGSLVALAPLLQPAYLAVQGLGGLALLVAARQQPWRLIGFAAVGTLALAGSVLLFGLGWPGGLGLGVALSGAVVAGFADFMPRRTARGAAQRARWRQFTLAVARLDRLAPAQAERLLPYAIAAGVGRRRLAHLGAALAGPVGWYTGAKSAPRLRGPSAGAGGSPGWGAAGGRSGGGGASRGFDGAAVGSGLAGLSGALGSALAGPASSGGAGGSGGSFGGARGGGGGGGW
jgi:Predicted membrane protein (DUF2207)